MLPSLNHGLGNNGGKGCWSSSPFGKDTICRTVLVYVRASIVIHIVLNF